MRWWNKLYFRKRFWTHAKNAQQVLWSIYCDARKWTSRFKIWIESSRWTKLYCHGSTSIPEKRRLVEMQSVKLRENCLIRQMMSEDPVVYLHFNHSGSPAQKLCLYLHLCWVTNHWGLQQILRTRHVKPDCLAKRRPRNIDCKTPKRHFSFQY